ncbi:hypothetical protein CPB86DRAFT_811915 [Serendipita vermifera]|nr:hypothetical protein CPB86DRAFT_811915 [Serendipita vermifera]
MHRNAGIRASSDTPSTRHAVSSSDPPSTWRTFSSSFSIFGHQTRLSEGGIPTTSTKPGPARSQFTPNSRQGTSSVPGPRTNRAVALAPPSSFQAHLTNSSQAPSLSQHSSHVTSLSASSVSNYNYNYKAGSSISSIASSHPSTLSRSRTTDGQFQPPNQPISRSSSTSHRNGATSAVTGQNEVPQPQRINVKRLMSKPPSLPIQDRAQSAMAFSVDPEDIDDSDSMEDIRSNSLNILRKSKRRSRSVDILRSTHRMSEPLSPPIGHSGVAKPLSKPRLTMPATPSYLHGSHEARSPSTSGTVRQDGSIRPDPRNSYAEVQRSSSEHHEPSQSPTLLHPDSLSPSLVTPASAIALAWARSQKRLMSPTASSNSPASPTHVDKLPSAPMSGILDSSFTSSPTPALVSDANHTAEKETGSNGGSRNAAQITSPIGDDDPFATWRLAETALVPSTSSHETIHVSPTSSGTLGITMREFSRRLTGAFGRKEKTREKFISPHPFKHSPGPSVSQSIHSASSTSQTARTVSKASASLERPDTVSSTANLSQMDRVQPSQLANCHHPLHLPTGASGAVALHPVSDAAADDHDRNDFHQMSSWNNGRKQDVDGDEEQWAYSPKASQPLVTSPTSMTDSTRDQGKIPPARSHTPNTLKKRSRGSLRSRPSISAPMPVVGGSRKGQYQSAPDATVQPHSQQNEVSTSSGGNAGGRFRELVRKLSSGNLKRPSSHNDKPCEEGVTYSSSSRNRSREDFIPPVPRLPKDFELIVDPEAYLAERAKRADGRYDSDADSVPASNHVTPFPNTGSSQYSSRRSSPIPSTMKRHTDPDIPMDTPTKRSAQRNNTDLNNMEKTQPRGAYVFPKRPMPKPELSSSASNSGTDHVWPEYRSSSPSPSSSDLHSSRRAATSFDEFTSASSHEMPSSSQPHSLIGQPIRAPRELFRRVEEEAATLRTQRSREGSTHNPQRKDSDRVDGRVSSDASLTRVSRDRDRSVSPPPPMISPMHFPSLGVPPPRPPRRSENMGKASARGTNNIVHPQPRPGHRHQRSLSSPPPVTPMSPDLPKFTTANAVNSIPLSKRSRSLTGVTSPPLLPPVQSVPPITPTLTRSKSQTSLNKVSSKRSKTLPPLVLESNSPEKGKFTLSPGEISVGDSTSPSAGTPSTGKSRTKSTSGALTRVRSLMGSKSASQTPTSSGSYSTMSPQSSGRRSTGSRRASRDFDSEMPPMPFTATAFAFREISQSPPSARQLTEVEREDMWNALLQKSEQAGGTLTVVMDPLLSDNTSILSRN